MTEEEEIVREKVAKEIEAKLKPRVNLGKYEGGYDCCSCPTYDTIVEDAVRVALGFEPEGFDPER